MSEAVIILFVILALSVPLAWVWLIAGRTHGLEEYLRRLRIALTFFIALVLTGAVGLSYLVERWLARGG